MIEHDKFTLLGSGQCVLAMRHAAPSQCTAAVSQSISSGPCNTSNMSAVQQAACRVPYNGAGLWGGD